LVNPYSDVGILPTMLLPFSCNIDSSEALTMLDGMSPASEFAPRFNKASLVRVPIDVGRLPVREFWLRSR